jgi:hypothetical protein
MNRGWWDARSCRIQFFNRIGRGSSMSAGPVASAAVGLFCFLSLKQYAGENPGKMWRVALSEFEIGHARMMPGLAEIYIAAFWMGGRRRTTG